MVTYKNATTEKPKEFESVLAEISHVNSLGTSKWFEVVYYAEGGWHCYAGSKTFRDGETVLRWRYAKDAIEGRNEPTY